MTRATEPDLTLIVKQAWLNNDRVLNFVAKTRKPQLGLNYTSFDSKPFRTDPQEHFRQLLGDREQMQEEGFDDWLGDRGAQLFAELLPIELQRRLCALVGRVNTCQILSDEVWIPWELLRLRDPDKPSARSRFLVEVFHVTRWLPGSELTLELPLRRMALVIPRDSGLPKVGDEGERVKSLGGALREVVEIPANRQDVKNALATGEFDGWHFAGHGSAHDGSPNRWSIVLERNQSLLTADLYGEASQLGRARPFVFLNACHSGRGAASLTGMVGLASAFLQAGAGAFVGSHWALEDEQAFCFAEELYRHLFAGIEIGEAVAKARLRLRENFHGSSDWLAYTVFAHPLARCRLRAEAKKRTRCRIVEAALVQAPVSESREVVPEPDRPTMPMPGEEQTHPRDGTVLVYVPGGEVVLGDEAHPSSRPLRRVRLSPFWIGKFLVTNEQFSRYLAENPSSPRPAFWDDPRFNQPRLPVVGLSWEEAAAYCAWAGLELPTEAQWEAAARGLDRRAFPWGAGFPTPHHANFDETNGGTTPVGTYLAGIGPYGTHDQAGNVWEWCADPWAADAFKRMQDRQRDPVASGAPSVRSLRGGSWLDPAAFLTATRREKGSAGRRLNNQGFRCVWRPA